MDSPVLDVKDAIGQCTSTRKVVLDHQQGRATGSDIPKNSIGHQTRGLLVQLAEEFVCEEDRRLLSERSGRGHPPLLPS